jgi:uncharacterized membrane protein
MKNEFLRRLEQLLANIPERDRQEILYDYVEHFQIGFENGKSEKELTEELGNPEDIARDLLADYRSTRTEAVQSNRSAFKVIMVSVGLLFFNLVFILGPVVSIFAVYLGLCVTALALTISPILFIISILFNGFTDALVNIFLSLMFGSLGGLLGIGMFYFGRLLKNMFLKYIGFNLRVIKGEKRL